MDRGPSATSARANSGTGGGGGLGAGGGPIRGGSGGSGTCYHRISILINN